MVELLLTIDEEATLLLGAIDWEKLDRLVFDPDEATAAALSPRRYREMASIYADFARRHGHAPNA